MKQVRKFKNEDLKFLRRFYGGCSGKKKSIFLDDTVYLVKCPPKAYERNLKNVQLSYINTAISEYIGSQIYRILEISVHKTELIGIDNKVCYM